MKHLFELAPGADRKAVVPHPAVTANAKRMGWNSAVFLIMGRPRDGYLAICRLLRRTALALFRQPR